MIKKIIHKVAAHKHPWRHMKFDELAEIYTSMTIRSIGYGVIGIFVPVYLYKSGVDLQSLMMFFMLLFIFRIPVAFLVGLLVARIGPKHTIAVSTVVSIVFLGLLLTYQTFNWNLIVLSLFNTVALAMFFIAYHVDFSKIQHKGHGGSELGWLFSFEKVGAAIGPFLGGVIASVFMPELAIVLAIAILFASLIPLFMTNEPVKTHQKISFKGFPLKKYARSFFVMGIFNAVNSSYNMLWPLFLGVFIFTENTYIKLGALTGFSIVISLFSARMFGHFIDHKKGKTLLQFGVIMGAVYQVCKSFIATPSGAIAVNTLGEPIILAYRMPLIKGVYDEADSAEGYRIVYFIWMEAITAVYKLALYVVLFISMSYFDQMMVIRVGFALLGIIGLGMLLQRFPALKKV